MTRQGETVEEQALPEWIMIMHSDGGSFGVE